MLERFDNKKEKERYFYQQLDQYNQYQQRIRYGHQQDS